LAGEMTHRVTFIAKRGPDHSRDGQYGWTVTVDGTVVCEVDSDEMDMADNALNPLWQALGVSVEFDYD
jgi:hypothetical protein